ncbi:MAG: hypothetical protein LBV67_06730 [Streptococcaceae bacterium]|jgi:hypothetical protein|nr:hypothetical protein [Streptococcaceae bacterium]
MNAPAEKVIQKLSEKVAFFVRENAIVEAALEDTLLKVTQLEEENAELKRQIEGG